MEVALRVPALSRGTGVVVFNENLASASQVEILDAAVVVSREDGPRYRAVLAALANPQSQLEAEVQPPANTLRLEGVIRLAADTEYATPTEALMGHRAQYEVEVQQALAFIKPTFNEEMRGGHTNM